MNNSDALSESYVNTFWADKPEPVRNMLRMAYKAGMNGFRGQAVLAALTGPLCHLGYGVTPEMAAHKAVRYADAIIYELNETTEEDV